VSPDTSSRGTAVSDRGSPPIDRMLGHPIAFVVSAVILFAVFGAPFVSEPDRVAPTKDPAFYTWRTEAFLTEEPVRLLEIEGPNGMFAAGYRMIAPLLGGLLRRIGGVASLSVTTILMVVLPPLISLLLASFVYRRLPDPVLWHAVAFASAGLLLTPPFVGYLDNVLCLFFLATALFFMGGTAYSWQHRAGFTLFLVLAGLTHPTTLAIFCVTLGLFALARFAFGRFDLRRTLRADGWLIACGVTAAVLTLAIWTVGAWGKPVSLGEAALPPPYGSDFFVDRMLLWIKAMRPLLTGPLLVIGLVTLLASGRRVVQDEVGRVGILWLAPLAGLFGFVAGLTYPYYRFFNTTLAWVVLVGIGAGVAMRFFLETARRGGAMWLTALGTIAVAFILGSNLLSGLSISGWTKEKNQWLEPTTKQELDELRAGLAIESRDRPVIFVIDDEPPEPFQVYGFSKLSGNTSRYALPPGQIDRGYLYLGDFDELAEGRPTERGEVTYDRLSVALLEDARAGMEAAEQPPIIVIASAFNVKGANADLATQTDGSLPAVADGSLAETWGEYGIPLVWTVSGTAIYEWTPDGPVGLERSSLPPEDPGEIHIVRVVAAIVLLLIPGAVATWSIFKRDGLAAWLALVPALAAGLLSIAGFVVVTLLREPFTIATAWMTVVLAFVLAMAWHFSPPNRPPATQ
jgi:hypothetical protein